MATSTHSSITHPGMTELAVVAGLINRVRSLDASGMAEWFVPHRVWPERERVDIASFDLILSYLSDADGVVQANLRRPAQTGDCLFARRRIGPVAPTVAPP